MGELKGRERERVGDTGLARVFSHQPTRDSLYSLSDSSARYACRYALRILFQTRDTRRMYVIRRLDVYSPRLDASNCDVFDRSFFEF